MKIVAVSDLHGDLLPVHKIFQEEQPELLLCAGDWGIAGEVSAGDFKQITDQVFTLTAFGNHDSLELLPTIPNRDGSPILIENGEVRVYGGCTVGGISGIWAKSKKKPWYINDHEVAAAAEQMKGDDVDILITHGCPRGMADLTPIGTHGGQQCFTKAFQTVNPQVHICGHLHRQSFYQAKDGRLIVNVGFTKEGDYAVFRSNGDQFEFERKRLQAAA